MQKPTNSGRRQPHIVAIINLKGGVGKTTTAINLAGVLSEIGKKILVVDIDPQASASLGLGCNIFDLKTSIRDIVIDDMPIADVLVKMRPNIDLIPSSMQLAFAETKLYERYKREDRLKIALAEVQDSYDFILIDCPPNMGLFVINGISAARHVLIPMATDFFSMVGVRLLLEFLVKIKKDVNPRLSVLGILPTRYDGRTTHAKDVLAQTRSTIGLKFKVFDTMIRETVRIKEQPISGQTITEYSSDNTGSQDYRAFAKEFLDEIERQKLSKQQ